MIRFACPLCRTAHSIAPEHIGQLVTCAKCQQTMTVPKAPTAILLPSVPIASAASTTAAHQGLLKRLGVSRLLVFVIPIIIWGLLFLWALSGGKLGKAFEDTTYQPPPARARFYNNGADFERDLANAAMESSWGYALADEQAVIRRHLLIGLVVGLALTALWAGICGGFWLRGRHRRGRLH
jgi:hypothetical protein